MPIRLTCSGLAAFAVGTGCTRPCEATRDCETTSVPLEFYSVTVGDGFSCGLATAANEGDVGLVCWGAGGRAADPPIGVRFTEVAAGHQHMCGIDQDRGIRCWGDLGIPQTEAPTGPGGPSYQFLSVSPTHNCAIASATVPRCWGAPPDVSVEPPPDLNVFATVAAGHGHTCTLEFYTHMRCAGDAMVRGNRRRRPPCFTRSRRAMATAADSPRVASACAGGGRWANEPPPSARFRKLVAAASYACGLDTVGRITG
ncbi:MAG: hypothetical protein AB7O24_20440 [Kofleriaceae bacterium]